MTDEELELTLELGFEERADQVDETVLREHTVKNDHFEKIETALVARGLVLLEGPRGCGKTHLMRYTALQCRDNQKQPLAIYVSFNRYLRLEPLLHRSPDAILAFQAWVLSNILIEIDNLARRGDVHGNEVTRESILAPLGLERGQLDRLVDHLERQIDRSEDDDYAIRALSIAGVQSAILNLCDHFKRARAVVLLDDAALTLTPEFLVEFFEVVRVLKHNRIAPKASVYPGSTEYGPRFHATHEGKTVSAWLSVESDAYVETMRSIASKRYPDAARIPQEINEVLAYAAFGIPRAYLSMLREFNESHQGSQQQVINTIIRDRNRMILSEYASLATKVPRLRTLVATGTQLFEQAVEAVRAANDKIPHDDKNIPHDEKKIPRDEKQLTFGLETGGITPMVQRMLNLLIEAGLLFEHEGQVSHGGGTRVYRRFTPHLAALLAVRAFSGRSRGESPKQILEVLRRPAAKHPVRRKVDTLIDAETVTALRFDLPACQKCDSPRITETQLFCANCGTRLVTRSIFENCMLAPIDVVLAPRVTEWLLSRVTKTEIKTVGDVIAMQDPGTELRKIHRVGEKRAGLVLSAINAYIDEYLS